MQELEEVNLVLILSMMIVMNKHVTVVIDHISESRAAFRPL